MIERNIWLASDVDADADTSINIANIEMDTVETCNDDGSARVYRCLHAHRFPLAERLLFSLASLLSALFWVALALILGMPTVLAALVSAPLGA